MFIRIFEEEFVPSLEQHGPGFVLLEVRSLRDKEEPVIGGHRRKDSHPPRPKAGAGTTVPCSPLATVVGICRYPPLHVGVFQLPAGNLQHVPLQCVL